MEWRNTGAAQPRAGFLWDALTEAFTAHAWDHWGRLVDEARRVGSLTEEVARVGAVDGLRLARPRPLGPSGEPGDPANH